MPPPPSPTAPPAATTRAWAHDDKAHDVEPASRSAIEHHDDHHAHTPHESPKVMTIPLAILAMGALFAGLVFKNRFIGEGMDEFWKGALAHGPDNHIMHEIHNGACLGAALALRDAGAGLRARLLDVYPPPELPHQLATNQPLLYRFLLNKWYFDEIYDRIFVRPARASASSCGRSATAGSSTGWWPNGIAAAWSTSPAGWSACRPVTSTTTLS